MSCGNCLNSGWILPPLDSAHTCTPVAMRCECYGGPEVLALTLEKSDKLHDRTLGNRIRNQFKGISLSEYQSGRVRFKCDCGKEAKKPEPVAPVIDDDEVPF